MNLFFYIFLFIFGNLFGSFASVLIYRIKSGEGGIIAGRSHCKTCQRDLTNLELVPIFSWLFQGGKCKGCHKKISVIYPLLEICMGTLFVGVGYFLIDPSLIMSGVLFEWIRMLFFLFIMFLTVIYVFYDILYLEIPESILLTANIFTVGVLIVQGLGYSIIPYLTIGGVDSIAIVICLSILGALYAIMIAGLREIYDVLIVGACICILGGYVYLSGVSYYESALLSGTLAALVIFISFFVQIIISGGKWMGAGDLRIAILMGLLVGVSFAFQAWMITYLVGSIIGISLIMYSKVRHGLKKSFNTQIPFGPFLAIGYLSILFFHPHISKFIEWYL